jgi:cytochrome c-type biogenesis protein CcmH
MLALLIIACVCLLGCGLALLRSARCAAGSERLRVLVAVVLPVVITGALYAVFGHPAFAPRPFVLAQAERQATDPALLNNAERALLLEEILQSRPKDAEGWRLLGHVYLSDNRLPEAVQAFAKAMRLNPAVADSYAGYAGARLRLSDGVADAATTAALAEALRLDPDHITAHLLSVRIAAQQGQSADTHLRALKALMPADDPRWAMLKQAGGS